MGASYFKELKPYTQTQAISTLGVEGKQGLNILKKLKEVGILKTVKIEKIESDLTELVAENEIVTDVLPDEDNNYFYVFKYVGVITVFNKVIICYPKFYDKKPDNSKIKQIIKVIEKYNTKKQEIKIYTEDNSSIGFNFLAIALFFLQDYFDNGIYTNEYTILESNGTGEINWDKTINETFMLLQDNRPYYADLKTKKRVVDNFDYFKRLHEFVLTDVSNILTGQSTDNLNLADLFDLTTVELTEDTQDDFGDKEYILYRIDKELKVQFQTRKQLLLKALSIYIEKRGTINNTEAFSMYGTNSFNLLWETACAEVFNNRLHSKVKVLLEQFPNVFSKFDTYDNRELIELIDKPLWNISGYANDTLIPDIISVSKDSFIIYDAKYYTPTLEKSKPLSGVPGIESVTKQYLYQLAYKKYLQPDIYNNVKNYFLMPTENNIAINKGSVSLEFFREYNLADIEVWLLPAETIFKAYLAGEKFTKYILNS